MHVSNLQVANIVGSGQWDGWYVVDGQDPIHETPFNSREMAQLYLENYGAAYLADRRNGDKIDGYDRDDLGESHDF